jgi:uncharacterized protein
MAELIYETVVTSCDAQGRVHVAPMGVRYPDPTQVLLMPFKPSTTLDNITRSGSAVLNWVTDVRVFAGCVTGRRDWPTVAVEPIRAGASAMRLVCADGHAALELERSVDDAQRPVLHMRRGPARVHTPFVGFNRAQAAVVEAAVLVSRLSMLPDDKIDREFEYLRIAIDKTAGPVEQEAWQWVCEAVAAHRGQRGARA